MLKVYGHLAPFQPPTRNPLRSPRTHLHLTSAMLRASSISSFLDRVWEHATAAWLGNSHARRMHLATTIRTRSPMAALSTGCKTCRLCRKPDVHRPDESSLQLVELCRVDHTRVSSFRRDDQGERLQGGRSYLTHVKRCIGFFCSTWMFNQVSYLNLLPFRTSSHFGKNGIRVKAIHTPSTTERASNTTWVNLFDGPIVWSRQSAIPSDRTGRRHYLARMTRCSGATVSKPKVSSGARSNFMIEIACEYVGGSTDQLQIRSVRLQGFGYTMDGANNTGRPFPCHTNLPRPSADTLGSRRS